MQNSVKHFLTTLLTQYLQCSIDLDTIGLLDSFLSVVKINDVLLFDTLYQYIIKFDNDEFDTSGEVLEAMISELN